MTGPAVCKARNEVAGRIDYSLGSVEDTMLSLYDSFVSLNYEMYGNLVVVLSQSHPSVVSARVHQPPSTVARSDWKTKADGVPRICIKALSILSLCLPFLQEPELTWLAPTA